MQIGRLRAGRAHGSSSRFALGRAPWNQLSAQHEIPVSHKQRRVVSIVGQRSSVVRYQPSNLFRIWLICAILWVAGVAAIGGPHVYREFKTLDEMTAAIEKRRAGPPLADLSHEEFLAALPEIRIGAPSPRRSLLRTIGVALLPPLALLAIGCALLWTHRRFRNGRPAVGSGA
jgi:hypothetical protein